MSSMLDRLKLGRHLGKLFGGKRDLYTVFGYSTTVTYQQIYAKYFKQDITARIIDAPANALWDNPPAIEIEGYDNFSTEWEKLVKRLDLWQMLSRADKMAGMGEFSVLIFGLNDGTKIDKPVKARETNELLYLQPYAQDTVEIEELVSDPQDPRYMLPKTYRIEPAKEINVSKLRKMPPAFIVDASRVLHIVESPLINNVYGNPRGVRIYNLLDDLLKIVGGTAETFWLTANRGMQVDVDKEMELTDADAENLSAEIDEYFHELRRVIRTRGVKINTLGSDVPNPKQVFEMQMALISGATGIPKRILVGSEAGQLASEQDRSNWAERIGERRTSFGNPVLMNTILAFSRAGVLKPIEPEQITINWPDAFKLSPLERANTSNQTARSAVNLAKALEGTIPFISVDEAREVINLGPAAEADLPEPPNEDADEGLTQPEDTDSNDVPTEAVPDPIADPVENTEKS